MNLNWRQLYLWASHGVHMRQIHDITGPLSCSV
jgi:hypothetical protein